MKTIIKKKYGQYYDSESNKEVTEKDILQFIRSNTSFVIQREEDKQDITDEELAQMFVRQAKSKTEAEGLFDSFKEFIDTGRSSVSHMMQNMLLSGYGAILVTEKRAREFVDQMVESGRVSREKGEELFEKAKKSMQEQEKQFEQKAKTTIQKNLRDLGIATPEDLDNKIQTAVANATDPLKKDIKALQKKTDELSEKLENISSK